MISEEDKLKVKEKAKQIMNDFMKALDEVEDIPVEFGANRTKDTRDFFGNKYEGEEFKERFLKNAKNVEDDQIVAEKKKWQKKN